MPTFLFKTEPTEYSYDDLVRDGSTLWTGVSNPQALIHLRTCRAGDDVLIYHTGTEKSIVGLARVKSSPIEDPARPGLNDRNEIKFAAVTLTPIAAAKSPVTLATIKADARFKDFPLVTQSRLSVMPVAPTIAKALRTLAGM